VVVVVRKNPLKEMLGVKIPQQPSKKLPPTTLRQAALEKILPRPPARRWEERQVGTKVPMQDPHPSSHCVQQSERLQAGTRLWEAAQPQRSDHPEAHQQEE
jgi:hypothetical protein